MNDHNHCNFPGVSAVVSQEPAGDHQQHRRRRESEEGQHKTKQSPRTRR